MSKAADDSNCHSQHLIIHFRSAVSWSHKAEHVVTLPHLNRWCWHHQFALLQIWKIHLQVDHRLKVVHLTLAGIYWPARRDNRWQRQEQALEIGHHRFRLSEINWRQEK